GLAARHAGASAPGTGGLSRERGDDVHVPRPPIRRRRPLRPGRQAPQGARPLSAPRRLRAADVDAGCDVQHAAPRADAHEALAEEPAGSPDSAAPERQGSVGLSPRARPLGLARLRVVSMDRRPDTHSHHAPARSASRRRGVALAVVVGLTLAAAAAVGAASTATAPVSRAPSVKDSPGYVPLFDPESTAEKLGRRTNAPIVSKPFRGGASSLDAL